MYKLAILYYIYFKTNFSKALLILWKRKTGQAAVLFHTAARPVSQLGTLHTL